MKNNKEMRKKYMEALSNIFLWTLHTEPWCNMLQTLGRRRKYIGIFYQMNTLSSCQFEDHVYPAHD